MGARHVENRSSLNREYVLTIWQQEIPDDLPQEAQVTMRVVLTLSVYNEGMGLKIVGSLDS